ncbi:MAG: glycerol-3-phosphate 1-O-acyltransferase PlsY [Clostridium sp.]|nr:glycerol-3-phosphate 1-O-acyltransferase PlsY [Clostridium sp.]MCM1400177.1 glycerol-3-phosphate 1-O-acyltransferase PlsY [Clostridium sp.]MCM1460909.1 glycerol-3-phosphate 1-O-acyltransferase PlsY [Bacteroides sp.]
MILARIICLMGGYVFGLLQTSYIYGRLNGIDIREYGSGNAGTTNALRVLGKKAGLIVFLGDSLKAVAAAVIARLVINNIYPNEVYMFIAYAGIGVVLGHNFPFYLKFRGGKGIAATAGVALGFLDPVIILSCLVIFTVAVAATRYVSLGSILMVLTFGTEYAIFAGHGKYSFLLTEELSKRCMIESIIVVEVMVIMAIYRHKTNIKRLLTHEENKLGKKQENNS